jgi:hypothetical protein
VVELRVPELVEDPFREHYRALIIGSILQAAETQSALHRSRGHKLRARRAERVADRLRASEPTPAADPVVIVVPEPVVETPRFVPVVEYDPWFSQRIRRTAALVWFATLGTLLANLVVLGVDSYATAAADLGLVAMSFVWFFAWIDDLL